MELELSLQITAVGDTTAREISAASQEVRDVLERLAGVERIEPQRAPPRITPRAGWSKRSEGLRSRLFPRC